MAGRRYEVVIDWYIASGMWGGLEGLLTPQESKSVADAVWIGAGMKCFSDEKNSGVIDAPCGGEVWDDRDKMTT